MHILPPHTPQYFLVYTHGLGLHVRPGRVADGRMRAADTEAIKV